jgi:hypothetical protein
MCKIKMKGSRMGLLKYTVVLLSLLLFSVFLFAQSENNERSAKQVEEEIVQIQEMLEEIQKDYEKKIAKLQTRIDSLEKTKKTSELEKLLEEAQTAAQEKGAEAEPETKVFTGGQRQQQSLNPNISLTGDLVGQFSNLDAEEGGDGYNHQHSSSGGREFILREAEFHIISNLDPYTRAKFFLGIPGGFSLHIGEAYMEWLNLPLNVGLKIGQFRTQFGVLNRWHDHGLPQVDRPEVLTSFLDGEGLVGIGTGTNVLLPRLWAHVNELDMEIIYGGDGTSFTNEGGKQWVGIAHLKNYYDLTTNAYLELGASGAYGHHDPDGKFQTFLGGVDLTYKWVPLDRSKYRTVEFRNELIISQREELTGDVTSYGFYSYIENKLDARWWAGIRFDYTQLPHSNNEYLWGISPHLTFWQSEFVFLRLQYSHLHRTYDEDENVLFLQSVWSMGPHKHEAY